MTKLYALSLAISISIFSAQAQEAERPVRFISGDFSTGSNITKGSFSLSQLAPALYNDQYYVLVQFSVLPDLTLRSTLEKAGLTLLNYLPGQAYLAVATQRFPFVQAAQWGIRSINTYPATYKKDPSVQDLSVSVDKENPKVLVVSLYPGVDKEMALQVMTTMGAARANGHSGLPDALVLQPDARLVDTIAALPFVSGLAIQVLRDKPLNYRSKGAHAINALSLGRGLSGRGVMTGIGDDGDISTHLDFTGRHINRVFSYPTNHATHVAGTMAGAGLIDPLYTGNAPKAGMVSQFFSDIIYNTPVYITDYNMQLTNNSYYSSDNGCPGNSRYDATSRLIDQQLLAYPNLLHVVAAGNDGSLSCGGYSPGFATIKSGWQTGKNVLTVGAMKWDDYALAPFSSRGPVLDGRLKPEMVANGWGVSSTYAFNNYAWFFGTSMAAPNVTGVAAQLYERYRQLHGGLNPDAALIKTLFCNSAEDLGNPGPDYSFGFGMLHGRRALEALENNTYFSGSISGGAAAVQSLVVPAGARRLKLMLYWPDKEAAANAANTLVNDLDLVVTTPSAVQRLPLVLDPSPANVNSIAVEGVDSRNNIEQVVIENPEAGNYTLTVKGTSVPFGPQPYYLAYEIVQPQVKLDYPFGGETWVPGEPETIRWSAAGNESNTFSIDYSIDNGANWINISSTVPASSRSFAWTAPTAITNLALVRVSRNGTALSDQTATPFMILGQPVITLTNACEGAVNITWPAIGSATSYDIMQLTGDSMRVIGNTSALSFLVTGLQKTTTYWFAVRALNGAVAGRRSVAKNIVPGGGPCTAAAFDEDIKADLILSPTTGREFTLSAGNVNPPIVVQLKNLDDAAMSGSMTVSYSINNGAPVSAIINPTISAGAAHIHSFAPHSIPASGPFTMLIKVWVSRAGDNNRSNDTVSVTVKRLENNPVITLPAVEGFESTDAATYTTRTMGLQGNDHFDFVANTLLGRARSFVNTGFARTGIRALTLDQTPINTTYTTDSLTTIYNLQPYTTVNNQLRFDFYYKNHGQENRPGNKVWIRGSETDNWVMAYDLFANQAGINGWTQGSINLNEILDNASPPQSFSPSFGVRFGQEGKTSANSVIQPIDADDGYTFDDLRLSEAFDDIAIKAVLSPDKKGCGLGASTPVSIRVKSFAPAIVSNIAVSYRINGGAVVTEVIPTLAPGQTLDYTFAAAADFSAYIDYTCNFWVSYSSDTYRINDSIIGYSFHNSPVIASYPYLEGFESTNGNWYTKGYNGSWQWGTPAKTVINKAANGSRAWVTSLTGRYNNTELSYLYSPCFDLSGMTQPVLSFSHIYDLEDNCPCDYTWAEYSADGGLTWQKLGTTTTGTNWHNDGTTNRWQTSFKKWHVASSDIPVTGTTVRFRFVMVADGGVTFEGVGIDDVHVFDKAAIYTGAPITTGLSQVVNGSGWVHFTDATGKRIASVNSFGQNLGLTEVQVYPYSGPVRISNNQYYADRNIVIRPASQPATNVAVRFYFTDTEAKSLIAATGCASCTKPGDPYELGVTQYSGQAVEENGTLADNLSAFYNYIAPANTDIIPYDNGYYAEYAVSGFSEFWLNNGGVNGNEPLPLNLLRFEAIRQGSVALLRWSTTEERQMDKIVVERSGDSRLYSSIGSVAAQGGIAENQYQFTDPTPLSGLNYYRLRFVNRDGSFARSPVRRLNFDADKATLVVYPNPVQDGVLFIASSVNLYRGVLTDVSGKALRTYTLQGRNNRISVSGLAKGVYQLTVWGEGGRWVEKVIVQ